VAVSLQPGGAPSGSANVSQVSSSSTDGFRRHLKTAKGFLLDIALFLENVEYTYGSLDAMPASEHTSLEYIAFMADIRDLKHEYGLLQAFQKLHPTALARWEVACLSNFLQILEQTSGSPVDWLDWSNYVQSVPARILGVEILPSRFVLDQTPSSNSSTQVPDGSGNNVLLATSSTSLGNSVAGGGTGRSGATPQSADKKYLPPNFFDTPANYQVPAGKSFLEGFKKRSSLVEPENQFGGNQNSLYTLQGFWDRFYEEVHCNGNISQQQKLETLICCLKGEAKRRIAHFLALQDKERYMLAVNQLFAYYGSFETNKQATLNSMRLLSPKSSANKDQLSYLEKMDEYFSLLSQFQMSRKDCAEQLMQALISHLREEATTMYISIFNIDSSERYTFYMSEPYEQYHKYSEFMRKQFAVGGSSTLAMMVATAGQLGEGSSSRKETAPKALKATTAGTSSSKSEKKASKRKARVSSSESSSTTTDSEEERKARKAERKKRKLESKKKTSTPANQGEKPEPKPALNTQQDKEKSSRSEDKPSNKGSSNSGYYNNNSNYEARGSNSYDNRNSRYGNNSARGNYQRGGGRGGLRQSGSRPPCWFCGGDHFNADCNYTTKERYAAFKQQDRCYRCGWTGHRAIDCPKPKDCDCGSKPLHHPVLCDKENPRSGGGRAKRENSAVKRENTEGNDSGGVAQGGGFGGPAPPPPPAAPGTG